MSTLRVNTIQDSAGTGTPSINGLAKAWVNFNGTGTVAIRQAFNVSSITDNGTGDYTVNFTTAMPNANYAAVTGARQNTGLGANSSVITPVTYSTTSLRLQTSNADQTLTDMNFLNVAIFSS